MALLALSDARHPFAAIAYQHAAMFRVAGIAGCDIQCMPYQVCRNCKAPYRHNQRESRKCLVCGKETLEQFQFKVSDGRRLTRVDIERDYYRNTHLVLGRRSAGGYGVDPEVGSGSVEQPFPDQVVRHLANMFRDAEKIGGARRDNFLAFTLGWFSHVVSDALFKGVYPQSVRVNFFGHQYNMAMLPAAESLTMTDMSYDFGVHWPRWREELRDDEADGGALRHLTMGNAATAYDAKHWTAEFGKPDPAIGRVMDAVRPLNRKWFYEMYFTPDYSAATPRLEGRKFTDRAEWKFNDRALGQVRSYAISTGWYNTFITGVDIYMRIVTEATRRAGLAPMATQSTPGGIVNWTLWRNIVAEATQQSERAADWGSRLSIDEEAITMLQKLRGRPVKIASPEPATDYQQQIAQTLRKTFAVKSQERAEMTVMIGPPAFNQHAVPLLCREDMLRLKYDSGLAALVKFNAERSVLHLIGFSDFGDRKLIDWLLLNNTRSR
jgi:hypothetical protein